LNWNRCNERKNNDAVVHSTIFGSFLRTVFISKYRPTSKEISLDKIERIYFDGM
jgi:hypothetical protein